MQRLQQPGGQQGRNYDSQFGSVNLEENVLLNKTNNLFKNFDLLIKNKDKNAVFNLDLFCMDKRRWHLSQNQNRLAVD